MKVLLVDDDRLVLEGLEKMIDWESLDADIVGMAENGADALHIAQSNTPDVIITDVSMPVMDGLEMIREIRESIANVHIFLISGHDDFEYARQAIRYGVKNYILKPVNRETIRSLYADLQKIQQEMQENHDHYLSLFNDSLGEDILAAMKSGDEAYFDELFRGTEKKCRKFPNLTVEICLKLLHILYRYFDEIHLPEENIEKSRQHSFEEMLALRKRGDKLDFVFQKYYDVLSGISKQKHLNVGSIAVSAKKMVDEGFTGVDLNISYLADQLGCTPAYLSTVFRQAMGVNLSVYITSLRIEYSKKLLRDINRNIADVSQEVGYADSHYFAKLFKKNTGLTPSEFRNLAIQSDSML